MNPVVLAIAITATLGLEVMMYGAEEFAPSIIPTLDRATPDIDQSVCNEGGFGDDIMCVARTLGQWFANLFGFVVWVFQLVGYVSLWFVGLASFSIDGAPFLVRVVFLTIIGGSAGWALASWLRGVKA